MGWLILGMIFGGILITLFTSFFVYRYIKLNGVKRLTRKLGQSAENVINKDIRIWAKHTKSKFIPAALYKYNENQVFEADSILITSKAIIAIEIKSIKGKITGDARDLHWIKNVGSATHKTSNSIMQNDKHIEHILAMTKSKLPIISLIIYSNRTEAIDISNIPPHVVLTRHIELFHTLDTINKILPLRIQNEDKKHIYNIIISSKTNKSKDLNLHKRITRQVN